MIWAVLIHTVMFYKGVSFKYHVTRMAAVIKYDIVQRHRSGWKLAIEPCPFNCRTYHSGCKYSELGAFLYYLRTAQISSLVEEIDPMWKHKLIRPHLSIYTRRETIVWANVNIYGINHPPRSMDFLFINASSTDLSMMDCQVTASFWGQIGLRQILSDGWQSYEGQS